MRAAAEALVGDDLLRAGAEAARCAEGACQRSDDHVDLGGVDVLVLGDAAAGTAEDAEGGGFVEEETEFVAAFELDLLQAFSWSLDGTSRR